MSQAGHPAAPSFHTACIVRRCGIVICLLLLPAALSAQTAQQSGSLADVARQVRAQKQGQPGADSNRAQQVADELSEDQNDTGAPGGLKTYDAGDYRLWVPAPYKVEGHDDAGIVLSGPNVGVKRPMVLVGAPIAARFQNNDTAFQETATSFVHLYAPSTNCERTTIADRAAYRCGLAAASLLGSQVSGNAVFVQGKGNIYPVFCVTPTDSQSRDVLNDAHASYDAKLWAKKTLDREEADSRKVWHQCETVFQSILVTPEHAPQRSAQASGSASAGEKSEQAKSAPVDSAQPGKSPATGAAGPAIAGGTASAADHAPPTRADQAQAATILSSSGQPGQASTSPPGYKVHPFHYCSGPQQCWDASVLIPADAKLVSSSCKQYVFETKVQGTSVLLLAGPARGECDEHGASPSDPVRWKLLTDPESKRAPGSYSTIGSQVTQLDGRAATILTLAFRVGLTSWMGKRAEVESNGVPLVVGCMAPRDHFEDGDAVCSTLIGSLQLP